MCELTKSVTNYQLKAPIFRPVKQFSQVRIIATFKQYYLFQPFYHTHFSKFIKYYFKLSSLNSFRHFLTMRLCHQPDGSTSPKYKLLCFIITKKICKEKNALAFNRDRRCHLVLCLRLIPFHYFKFTQIQPATNSMNCLLFKY